MGFFSPLGQVRSSFLPSFLLLFPVPSFLLLSEPLVNGFWDLVDHVFYGGIGWDFLGKAWMKHTSYSFPEQEIDAGSIFQVSVGSLAPGPVPSWELWRRVWMWLPPISCQQTLTEVDLSSLGAHWSWTPARGARGSSLLLGWEEQTGDDLVLEVWVQTRIEFWGHLLAVCHDGHWALHKRRSSGSVLKEWFFFLLLGVRWCLHVPCWLWAWLTSAPHSCIPVAVLWCPSQSSPSLCFAWGLKCLPRGHLSSHRELYPSLPSSGKETLKKNLWPNAFALTF